MIEALGALSPASVLPCRFPGWDNHGAGSARIKGGAASSGHTDSGGWRSRMVPLI